MSSFFLIRGRTTSRLRGLAAVAVLAPALSAVVATTAPAASAVGPQIAPRSATSTSPAPASGVGAASAQAKADAYWTKARMRAAKPLVAKPGALEKAIQQAQKMQPLRANGPASTVAGHASTSGRVGVTVNASPTVGRVFFYNPQRSDLFAVGNYTCSAASLNSGSKQLVVTAGHCVHGGRNGTWFQNWVFVPSYNNGSEPYGRFALKQARTFNSWISSNDFARDVAMVTTWPNSRGAVVNVVGGNGLSWNWPKSLPITVLGYPAETPYNGQTQQFCTGTTSDWGSRIALRCGFTGGSSGGPWLKDYNNTSRLGNVNGDMSTLDRSTGWNASPYYDQAVKDMFDAQGNVT